MDDSMSSTNYIQSFSSTHENSSEESGWTLYFEDLANNNYKDVEFSLRSSSSSSTMVSSYGHHVKKLDNKKLMSKNRKAKVKTFVDEELEDTASSPSHSPKEKGQTSQHAREEIGMGFLETQLRRKGLCLVPMSMLLNHL